MQQPRSVGRGKSGELPLYPQRRTGSSRLATLIVMSPFVRARIACLCAGKNATSAFTDARLWGNLLGQFAPGLGGFPDAWSCAAAAALTRPWPKNEFIAPSVHLQNVCRTVSPNSQFQPHPAIATLP
jgi:hypothetical protein